MGGNTEVEASRRVIIPLLTRLLNTTSDAEVRSAGLQLRTFVLKGQPKEAIYVFAHESWSMVESVLRVSQSQFNIQEFSQLPHQIQMTISAVGVIWGELFRKFPRDMSLIFVDVFDKSDSTTRSRFVWFSLPISKYLGRDVMDLAREQLTSKRPKRRASWWMSPRIVVFVCLLLATIGIAVFLQKEQQREQQKEQLYHSASESLNSGYWEQARNTLQQLFSLDNNYKDAQTLLRETYYRPAIAALNAGNWSEARNQFAELVRMDANYRDASTLLLETYYRPAHQYVDAQDWKNARAELMGLLARNPNYRDAQSLLDLAESHSVLSDVDLHVLPDPGWQDSGVAIQSGQEVRISAYGSWRYCDYVPYTGPAGYDLSPRGWDFNDQTLIGRVGSGEPFMVGDEVTFVADSSGLLELSMYVQTTWCSWAQAGNMNVHIRVAEYVNPSP